MKNTLVIADVHGRTLWKQLVDKHPEAERIIFLADYLDTHEDVTGAEQLYNLENILHLRRSKDVEVITLIGNHDYHYFPGISNACSGYQQRMAPSFQACLRENRHLFQMVYRDEHGYIYCHAGITESFLDRVGIQPTDQGVMVDSINDLWKYRANEFGFYSQDWSGYGDHVKQGPLWVRPRSLVKDGIDATMFVGHTQHKTLRHHCNVQSGKQQYYFCDTQESIQKQYITIDKEGNIKINSFNEVQD
jgi:hypothetical protein